MRCSNKILWILLVIAITMKVSPNAPVKLHAEETNVAEKNAELEIRIATFNVSLYGKQAGQIRDRLSDQADLQAKRLASIVQSVRPDILLVNELDYETDMMPAKLLAKNYFARAQTLQGAETELQPIDYPYIISLPSNTGIDSEMDLNRDGKLSTGNDAWGYGVYPGQYAMTVFSRFPIDLPKVRTFQKLRWSELPKALRPVNPGTGQSYYDDATWVQLRLSSKNHADVPIRIKDRTIHVLASHPTPPVFDGPEDRNGARNHDEIEFWNRYLEENGAASDWLVDDEGRDGGIGENSSFVIMGDLNADPVDGSGRREAIQRLLNHPRTSDVSPQSPQDGVAERATKHKGDGDIATKTADFGRNGFMRVDYVIPSSDLKVIGSGVFWPSQSDPRSRWVDATDHRLVWIDVTP